MKEFCNINGYQMAYVESGTSGGDPIVFLHGNPTSSYLWRNVMPPLESRGRLIAPDLIGMGDSDKLNNISITSYPFEVHADFLAKLLECVGATENVILVLHDWGSGLGFDWALKNQEAVKGIVYMEALVAPMEWSDFDEDSQQFFEALRTPDLGETLVLEQNLFIESIDSFVLRNLTEEVMDVYRAPYLVPGEGRRPTLTWPREVSIDGIPADLTSIMSAYSEWMAQNEIPKLFINTEPGFLLEEGRLRDFARTWKNQMEVTVSGSHFVQEDSPDEIAAAIDDWIGKVFVQGGVSAAPSPAPSSATSPAPSSATSPASGLHFIVTMILLTRFLLWK
jgi:haloalkane dehalogenase